MSYRWHVRWFVPKKFRYTAVHVLGRDGRTLCGLPADQPRPAMTISATHPRDWAEPAAMCEKCALLSLTDTDSLVRE